MLGKFDLSNASKDNLLPNPIDNDDRYVFPKEISSQCQQLSKINTILIQCIKLLDELVNTLNKRNEKIAQSSNALISHIKTNDLLKNNLQPLLLLLEKYPKKQDLKRHEDKLKPLSKSIKINQNYVQRLVDIWKPDSFFGHILQLDDGIFKAIEDLSVEVIFGAKDRFNRIVLEKEKTEQFLWQANSWLKKLLQQPFLNMKSLSWDSEFVKGTSFSFSQRQVLIQLLQTLVNFIHRNFQINDLCLQLDLESSIDYLLRQCNSNNDYHGRWKIDKLCKDLKQLLERSRAIKQAANLAQKVNILKKFEANNINLNQLEVSLPSLKFLALAQLSKENIQKKPVEWLNERLLDHGKNSHEIAFYHYYQQLIDDREMSQSYLSIPQIEPKNYDKINRLLAQPSLDTVALSLLLNEDSLIRFCPEGNKLLLEQVIESYVQYPEKYEPWLPKTLATILDEKTAEGTTVLWEIASHQKGHVLLERYPKWLLGRLTVAPDKGSYRHIPVLERLLSSNSGQNLLEQHFDLLSADIKKAMNVVVNDVHHGLSIIWHLLKKNRHRWLIKHPELWSYVNCNEVTNGSNKIPPTLIMLLADPEHATLFDKQPHLLTNANLDASFISLEYGQITILWAMAYLVKGRQLLCKYPQLLAKHNLDATGTVGEFKKTSVLRLLANDHDILELLCDQPQLLANCNLDASSDGKTVLWILADFPKGRELLSNQTQLVINRNLDAASTKGPGIGASVLWLLAELPAMQQLFYNQPELLAGCNLNASPNDRLGCSVLHILANGSKGRQLLYKQPKLLFSSNLDNGENTGTSAGISLLLYLILYPDSHLFLKNNYKQWLSRCNLDATAFFGLNKGKTVLWYLARNPIFLNLLIKKFEWWWRGNNNLDAAPESGINAGKSVLWLLASTFEGRQFLQRQPELLINRNLNAAPVMGLDAGVTVADLLAKAKEEQQVLMQADEQHQQWLANFQKSPQPSLASYPWANYGLFAKSTPVDKQSFNETFLVDKQGFDKIFEDKGSKRPREESDDEESEDNPSKKAKLI